MEKINIMENDKSHIVSVILIALAGVGTFLLMLWLTKLGPGISPDSVVYIGTARSLLSGQGFSHLGKAMTHYPPLYPILLAVFGKTQSGDVIQAARLNAAFFFGVNVFLVGLSVYVSTKRNKLATTLAIFIFLSSEQIMVVSAYAWSEAPYIAFTLLSLLITSFYIVQPKSYLLVLASLSVGLAMATRYVGIVLVPTVILALLFIGNRSLKKKKGDILLFVSVSSAIVVAWMVRNMFSTGTATNRNLAFHLVSRNKLKDFVNTLYNFVFPINLSVKSKALQIGIVVILVILLLVWMKKKNAFQQYINSVGGILATISIIFFVAYVSFLFFSISFIDAQTPLDSRILLPAYLATMIAFFSILWRFFEINNGKIINYSFIVVILSAIIFNIFPAISKARSIHENSLGFSSPVWAQSNTIDAVKNFPVGITIYTNGPEVINLHTEGKVKMIPTWINPTSLIENPNYEENMQIMCSQAQEGEAIVVYLDGIKSRTHLPSQQEFEELCKLQILEQLDDGTIYGN